MGLMSRALNSAHPDGGSLLRHAIALRSRVTAGLSTGPSADDDAAAAEKKKPSTPFLPRRSFVRKRRRAPSFSAFPRCLTASSFRLTSSSRS